MPFYGQPLNGWCAHCGQPIHKLLAAWYANNSYRCITGSLYHIPMQWRYP